MSKPNYPFNPWGDMIDAHVPPTDVTVTPKQGKNYVTFVPRAAPFHSLSFKLKIKGSSSYLVPGKDYMFGHFYKEFSMDFKVGIFGSVTLVNTVNPTQLVVEYDTVGGEFVLDEVEYAKTVVNIINNDREIDWSQIADVPSEFPPAPHEHPAGDTYNYDDFIQVMNGIMLQSNGTVEGVLQELLNHISQAGLAAHKYTKSDIGLDQVVNGRMAKAEDLAGNGDTLYMNLTQTKALFRLMIAGTLK